MQLHLVDTSEAVVEAWKGAFQGFPEVAVLLGDILAVARDTVVSPANAYGFMDGGIDAAYLRFFGSRLQDRVQQAISQRQEGYLPVGASLIVDTGDMHIPSLIVAPTMLAPEAIPSENCYRAMRAVLRIASREFKIDERVFCPGLGTGVARCNQSTRLARWQRRITTGGRAPERD